MEKKIILLPANDAVQNWFEENIDKECSASSAIYKFRLWLESLQVTRQTGAVWVKAIEFKTHEPIYRPFRRKREDGEPEYDYGEIYVTEDNGEIFLDINNERSYEPQHFERWKDYEILDESGTPAAGREDDWISVDERLPYRDGDSSVYCLVNDTYDGIVVRPFNEAHVCWDQEDGDDYYTDAKGGKVTHWRPLPEPPKRKQQKEK